jgi:hypothetical protein
VPSYLVHGDTSDDPISDIERFCYRNNSSVGASALASLIFLTALTSFCRCLMNQPCHEIDMQIAIAFPDEQTMPAASRANHRHPTNGEELLVVPCHLATAAIFGFDNFAHHSGGLNSTLIPIPAMARSGWRRRRARRKLHPPDQVSQRCARCRRRGIAAHATSGRYEIRRR